MNKVIFKIAALSSIAGLLATCSEQQPAAPDLSFEESLQQQLIEAQPGDVIEIPAGTHEMTRSLSLNVPGVTIRGTGIDSSVLSFANQIQGAEGLLVNADDFVIEDLAIEDTVGDALKINESHNVAVRNVRTEWTGGALTTNGAYGIYPVQSSNILIDGAVAIGASDAGIYVGQSNQIIVRNSRAEYNVAGIEIENSTFADVYDNVATNNTGGILVFDLPGLPVQGGRNTRVFNNEIINNNTGNFAPEGNIVGTVPAGSGLMVSEPLVALQANTGQPIPDVVWDGTMLSGKQANEILCMRQNGEISFVNLDAGNGFAAPNFDTADHNCELPALSEISLSTGAE